MSNPYLDLSIFISFDVATSPPDIEVPLPVVDYCANRTRETIGDTADEVGSGSRFQFVVYIMALMVLLQCLL